MAYNENNFDIDGIIVHIGLPVTKSEKFTYRIIVIEIHTDRFLSEAKFMFINQNMDLLKEGFSIKDRVQINFQISGRKYIAKNGVADWFVNLEALNISKL